MSARVPSSREAGARDLSLEMDRRSRERIRTELATSFLVEAGAGSGKTTELVSRMLALVQSGISVRQIAAVTFTRKAAGELSQKFREELEKARRGALASGDGAAARFDEALREIDRGFIGTIHAFCARLLRERPLAASVDPGFVEVSGPEEERLRAEFWTRRLADLYARSDPILARLRAAGLDPRDLGPRPGARSADLDALDTSVVPEAFRDLVADPDVDFPAGETPPPEFAGIREELAGLLDRARTLLPDRPLSEKGWDSLQAVLHRLLRLRRVADWSRASDFFAALETLKRTYQVTLKGWSDDAAAKEQVKELRRALEEFFRMRAAPALDAWYAHRYAIVLDFLRPLAAVFASHRRVAGQLTFQDLLTLAADLLRRDRDARRDLGERYRYLLVDEFQDTDPLQAEVCLLLASDPREEGGEEEWLQVRPRPGALFVVGDPKQSIYRFRRADIELYGLVKRRFAEFGDVLELTRSFRSGPAIGSFVNAVFQRLFPVRTTEEQAAFALLNAEKAAKPGRVLRYEIRPDGTSTTGVGAADARAVASWIERRVASGERTPGDFLVLPYRKAALELYARELERRNIPVTTTGAGLTIELELRELALLMRALADPGDPVWTLAALQGLFFGLDPGQLLCYGLDGGRLSFEGREFVEASPVGRALATLRRWADLCRDVPVDAALARIVHEIGLLPLAAGGELAESRAGSLAHVLDVVASAAIGGAADLRSAIEALEAAAASPDVEAPLRPGRKDAVRVMNLHKAKGLEAPVVILPYPVGHKEHEPEKHVERGEGERPVGWIRFAKAAGKKRLTLARPEGWEVMAGRELAFARAEHARLLYVAATRACEELVVGECPATLDRSPWGELHEDLEQLAERLEIPVTDPPPRRLVGVSARDVRARIEQVAATRARAAEPAFKVATVTDLSEEEFVFHGAEGRGREWGTIVHRATATMGRGRMGDALRRYCRALLLAEGRQADAAGEPLELEELMALLDALRASDAWRALTGGVGSRWELEVARLDRPDGSPPVLLTGVIDALGIGGKGQPWRVVDWKTDAIGQDEWAARLRHYRQQVEAYGEIVSSLVGAQVEATVERLARGPEGRFLPP